MRNYRLHFIRHGLIEANFTGQYIGRLDVPLCRRGLEELAEKRARYEYPAVGRVYVSPMQRCRQTAAILYPDQETVVVDNLAVSRRAEKRPRLCKVAGEQRCQPAGRGGGRGGIRRAVHRRLWTDF